MTHAVQVLVVAKEPVPGRVKTRLCPPLTPAQAAQVAAAAIEDTLDAVRQVPAAERVVVVDGDLRPAGFTVAPQVHGPFDVRLAAAFDEAAARGLPALLVGMDTPQLTPALLDDACRALLDADAVLGLAEDGGWWALGLREPDGALLRGIPTSRDDTGRRQAQRLRDAGLGVSDLPVLRDVDTVDDAVAVAAAAPGTRFAVTLTRLLDAARAG
jgi:rSAM/selenodomain-associated transferase 1